MDPISSNSLPFAEIYTDTFEHSLDEKGRVTVPSEWRSEAHSKRLHVMKSKDGCLRVYPVSYLSDKLRKLADAPVDDPRRKSLEAFVRSVQTAECDTQGRISLKGELRKAAGLAKHVVLAGCGAHFEVWDGDAWKARSKQLEASFEDVAREVGL